MQGPLHAAPHNRGGNGASGLRRLKTKLEKEADKEGRTLAEGNEERKIRYKQRDYVEKWKDGERHDTSFIVLLYYIG